MKWLATLLLLCACAGQDDGWEGSVETQPNGGVRVTNPATGVWDSESAWQLVPELVLGEVDGPEALVFGSISGLEADDAGRIYVLDRHANELRIFTAEGAHVRTTGRTGEGPGEYRAANGLLWLTSDTLLVVDQRGNRYSLLDREGQYIRSVPRGLGFYGWAFAGGIHDGRLYEISDVGSDDDRRPALLGTTLRDSVQGSRVAVSAETASVHAPMDTVLLPIPAASNVEAFSIRTATAGMSMSVPHAPAPLYHVQRTGSVWHGHGSEFRIVHSAFDGDTIMDIVVSGAVPTPVSPEELAEWEGGESVKRFREMGGKLDMGRIPRAKPFLNGIYVAADDHVWASLPAAPGEVLFGVFDPEGRYLGRLQIAGMRRDSYVPPVLRGGRLYFVGRDELDVPRVYVFRVDRQAAGGRS